MNWYFFLIQAPERNILVDTGMGSKDPEVTREVYGLSRSKLLRDIKVQGQGMAARDIDTVILSHLHFDHVGGAVRLDRLGQKVPTLPNATYLIQQSAWDEAHEPNERAWPHFSLTRDVLAILQCQ